MEITFITTGGTIDKAYHKGKGTYNFDILEPSINVILNNIRPNFNFNVVPILKKDSLDLNDEDRQLIFDTCNKNENNRIIVTHGTDSMIETAEKLSEINNKIIILVGSAQPERFKDTDADFGVGAAVGAINVLSEGVYIAMNGRIYKWNECKKMDSGLFVEKYLYIRNRKISQLIFFHIFHVSYIFDKPRKFLFKIQNKTHQFL